jgi:hypothetical protein
MLLHLHSHSLSQNFYCPPDEQTTEKELIAIRSEMNYKYLWMHGTEDKWMGATGTIDTPIHRKSFHVYPVLTADGACADGGWVLLKERDQNKFVKMIAPANTTADPNAVPVENAWVIMLGKSEDII